jgi:hypothetical protein
MVSERQRSPAVKYVFYAEERHQLRILLTYEMSQPEAFQDTCREAHIPRPAFAMVAESRSLKLRPRSAVSWCDATMTSMSSVPRPSNSNAST